MKIISKGSVAIITLLDDKGNTFAVCPVTDDAAVERTLDSGRYFVLRIKNAQGQQAFIGIAFNERNDAFDFNVSLSEFKSECEREKIAATTAQILPTEPKYDLTLKEGEKIHINIQSSNSALKKKAPVGSNTGSGKGLLAPPPSDKGGIYNPNPSAVTKDTNITNNNDIFAGFTSTTTTSGTSNSTTFSGGNDIWGSNTVSADPWGSTNINASNSNTSSDPWSSNFGDDAFAKGNSNTSDPFSSFGTVFSPTNSAQQKFDAFGFPI